MTLEIQDSVNPLVATPDTGAPVHTRRSMHRCSPAPLGTGFAFMRRLSVPGGK